MNDFHGPTPEEFDELVHDQKLDDLQAHELRLVLYHVDEDLKAFRERLEGRKPRRNWFGASKGSQSRSATWSLNCIVGGRRSTTSCLPTRRRKLGCSYPSGRWRLRSERNSNA